MVAESAGTRHRQIGVIWRCIVRPDLPFGGWTGGGGPY
jgi:hypothetical protein